MAMDEGAYIESFLQNNPMSTKSDEDSTPQAARIKRDGLGRKES